MLLARVLRARKRRVNYQIGLIAGVFRRGDIAGWLGRRFGGWLCHLFRFGLGGEIGFVTCRYHFGFGWFRCRVDTCRRFLNPLTERSAWRFIELLGNSRGSLCRGRNHGRLVVEIEEAERREGANEHHDHRCRNR